MLCFSHMRVLLRNASNVYYAGEKGWTESISNALNLDQVEQAIRVNFRHQLGAREVVLVYEKPPCTVIVPITPSAAPASQAD